MHTNSRSKVYYASHLVTIATHLKIEVPWHRITSHYVRLLCVPLCELFHSINVIPVPLGIPDPYEVLEDGQIYVQIKKPGSCTSEIITGPVRCLPYEHQCILCTFIVSCLLYCYCIILYCIVLFCIILNWSAVHVASLSVHQSILAFISSPITAPKLPLPPPTLTFSLLPFFSSRLFSSTIFFYFTSHFIQSPTRFLLSLRFASLLSSLLSFLRFYPFFSSLISFPALIPTLGPGSALSQPVFAPRRFENRHCSGTSGPRTHIQ